MNKQIRKGNDPVRYQGVWRFVYDMVWVLVVAVLLGILHGSAHFEQLAYKSFGLTQWLGAISAPIEHPAVIVVDISQIRDDPPIVQIGSETVTPRRPLLEILQAIAKIRPRAIAVDIDFSPDEEGWTDPVEDTRFLDACLEISKSTPIYLGADRTLMGENPSDVWLGLPDYQDMAVAIVGFQDKATTMPGVIKKDGNQLYSMSYRLAGHAIGRPANFEKADDWLPSQLVTKTPLIDVFNRVHVEGFWVETRSFAPIRDQTLYVSSPNDIEDNEKEMVGRVVIVGDASMGGESLVKLPGVEDLAPRIYLHAVATETLASGQVFTLTPKGEFWLDVVVGFVAAILILLINYLFRSRGESVREARLQIGVRFSVVFVLIISGVILAPITRFLWASFAVTGPMLFLAPWVERILPISIRRLGPKIFRAIRRNILQSDSEKS